MQECQECQNIKFERETETLTISVESGMRDGQVRAMTLTSSKPLLKGNGSAVVVGHVWSYLRSPVISACGDLCQGCPCVHFPSPLPA